MTRDMSMIRYVLMETEERGGFVPDDSIDAAHATLVIEAGLAHGVEPGFLHDLTPAGHDFVDLARNPDRWERVFHKIDETIGSAPFDVWVELLRADMMEDLS